MDKQKKQNQITNLKKLKEIVGISKFDTLQKLEKANKISKRFLDVAFVSKEMLNFAKSNYNIKNKQKKKFKNKPERNIWIFITPEKEILTTNVVKFSNILSKKYDRENDYLICIGFHASEFAQEKNYKTIFTNEKITGFEDKISNLLTKMVLSDEVDKVTFLLDSSRSTKGIINVFPIENLDIKYSNDSKILNDKQVFYPSIIHCIDTLLSIYIAKITHALITETCFYHLKEKLIKNETSIKNIDKLIDEKQKEINKVNIKKTTEDLIFMTQLAKRGAKND